MRVSVIICTHNRCQTLKQTIARVCEQDCDRSFEYEVLVIDNNSTDKTKSTVEIFMHRNPRIHYIFEGKQGLSNARNTGIRYAKGEVIAFIDDDVLIGRHWLLNVSESCKSYDFDAMGGKVLPLYPPETPKWIKEHREALAGPIVCHDYGEEVKAYDTTMVPFIGANMVIKKQVFKEVGIFNPELGCGKGSVGEDSEYFNRIKKAGKIILYNPHIVAVHPVAKERMGFKYIAQWNMASGKYAVLRSYTQNETQDLICYFGVPRYLFKQLGQRIWPLISAIGRSPDFIIEWGGFFWQLGKIQAYYSRVREKSQNEEILGRAFEG